MKLILVRHGEPDYEKDSLTEKGFREAQMVADRICKLDIKEIYCSTLGRARDTAAPTLERLGKTATYYPWLREFAPLIHRPDQEGLNICWDWLPQDWTNREDFYHMATWTNPAEIAESDVEKEYRWVCENFDALLEKHGYRRNGRLYDAIKPNNDTIVIFCHFGLSCVLLSHLLQISPMILWHGFCAAPTSVTTIITEERRPGKAYFRINSLGDISHLYVQNETPSFAARFSECYTNEGERLD